MRKPHPLTPSPAWPSAGRGMRRGRGRRVRGLKSTAPETRSSGASLALSWAFTAAATDGLLSTPRLWRFRGRTDRSPYNLIHIVCVFAAERTASALRRWRYRRTLKKRPYIQMVNILRCLAAATSLRPQNGGWGCWGAMFAADEKRAARKAQPWVGMYGDCQRATFVALPATTLM